MAAAIAGHAHASGTAEPPLYDPGAQAAAMAQLRQGHVEAAVAGFCAMLRPAPGRELWTVSLGLHCDAAELEDKAALITSPFPVFVQVREFEGRRCYRLCAGLTTSRTVASQWALHLPPPLKSSGPFPTQVILPCPGAQPQPPALAPGVSPTPLKPSPVTSSPPTPIPAAPVAKATEPPPSAPPPLLASKAATAPTMPAQSPSSKEAEEWFRRGLEAYQKGDHLAAFECYHQSLVLEPDRPEVLNNLGVLYLEEKRYQEAKPDFERAVQRSPNYAAAHLNLAGALWGLSDRDDALAEARKAAELDPRSVSAHLTLASFLLAMDQPGEAAAEAQRTILLDPQNKQAKAFLEAATVKPKPADVR